MSASELDRLARVYWFTIEFGVLRENGRVKAYGTGLLSSAGELAEMHKAELRPLDLDAAANHIYDPTHYQSVLFCADSFDEMYETLQRVSGALVRSDWHFRMALWFLDLANRSIL